MTTLGLPETVMIVVTGLLYISLPIIAIVVAVRWSIRREIRLLTIIEAL